MEPSLQVVLLSSRDLVRLGLQAVLGSLDPVPRIRTCLDPAVDADLVVVDAVATSVADRARFSELATASSAPVIVLTTDPRARGELAHWPRPVHAYLPDTASRDELLATITAALRRAPRRASPEAPSAPLLPAGLSHRELEVLLLISDGLSNTEIADKLYLGINTIKTYIRTAYRKIGVTSRTQAVLWTLHHGFGAHQERRHSDHVRAGT